MGHVVVLVQTSAKHPEIIDVWQPIEDAVLFLEILYFCVNDHVLAVEFEPISLNHDAYCRWPSTAASVEHTILFFNGIAIK